MDPTNIINPFEELSYLFEYSFNLSAEKPSNPQTAEMSQEKELVEMMGNVELGERMQEEYSGKRKRVSHTDSLMQSPLTIKDFCKLNWMLPLNINTEQLMVEKGKNENYLNAMLGLISNKYTEAQFSFAQIYPHSDNLVANRDFSQGETIIQISQNWMLPNLNFTETVFSRYLKELTTAILKGKSVLQTNTISAEIDLLGSIKAVKTFDIPIYLFENKFVEEIVNEPFTSTIEDTFVWLYFKLLPENFDYHPMKEWESIKPFHSELANHLQKMQYDFIQEYKLIKKLVDGQYFKSQHTFHMFLVSSFPNRRYMFEKYQSFFTPKNYVWAKLCERTRAFKLSVNEHTEYEYLMKYVKFPQEKKRLVPVLDLFHHSSTLNNLQWQYKPMTSKIQVKAVKNIKKGDLLYIKYKQMPLQSCYIDYGFADIRQPVDQILIQPTIFLELIEWIAKELFEKKVQRKFLIYLETYTQYHQLLIEIKVSNYDYECLQDCSAQKELILENFIHAYTELTFRLLNKMDPSISKKLYLKKESEMKVKMRKMAYRLIETSLQDNIRMKKATIQKIEKNNKILLDYGPKTDKKSRKTMKEQEKEQYSDFYQTEKEKKRFYALYHSTAIKTILTGQILILKKLLKLYSRNKLE